MSYEKKPDEALEAMLREDADDKVDMKTLAAIIHRLNSWDAPLPNAKTSADLVETLAAEMKRSSTTRLEPVGSWWPLLLLHSQARVVQPEIWFASALVIFLGTLVTLLSYQAESNATLPLVLLAPVVTAFGVAFLYDGNAVQMLELEDTTPVSVRVLLLARLTLVFGFNLLLMLGASLALALLHEEVSLWPLISAWLAPMTFLSALAFFISVVARDALAGGMLSLLLWAGHQTFQFTDFESEILYLLTMPGLSAQSTRPLLVTAALLLALVALWLAGKTERYLGGVR